MAVEEEKPPIWEAFCSALGTEYREAKEIIGASGITHQVQAIGVDDKGKRVVLVSGDSNPRIASLMRVDVQATMPDVRVLMARPLALDLAHAARKMFFTEEGTLDLGKIMLLSTLADAGEEKKQIFEEQYGLPAKALLENMARSRLPLRSHVISLVEQLATMDWSKVKPPVHKDDLMQTAVDMLTQFSLMDNLAADRAQGICPVPTYELTEADWDLFHGNKHLDEIRARLKDLDIYQYFYPPADSLALGLIDNGIATPNKIARGMELAQAQGHEISENALVHDVSQLPDLMDELKSMGYAVEGEFSLELTEEGKSIRQTVKIRPSEGLLEKLSRIMSAHVNLNLSDIFGHKP